MLETSIHPSGYIYAQLLLIYLSQSLRRLSSPLSRCDCNDFILLYAWLTIKIEPHRGHQNEKLYNFHTALWCCAPPSPHSSLLSFTVLSLFLGSFWIRLPLTGTRNIAAPSGRMRRNCSLSKLYHPLPLSLSLSLSLLFHTCLSGSLLSFIFMSAFLSCHIKLLN